MGEYVKEKWPRDITKENFLDWVNKNGRGYVEEAKRHIERLGIEEYKRQITAQDGSEEGIARNWCKEIFPKNARVLVVGCNHGFFTFRLAAEGYIVTGLDASNILIEMARDLKKELGFNDIKYICGDAMKIPIDEMIYDVAISKHTLEHIPNPGIALKEQARVAKKACGIVPLEEDVGNTEHLWFWTEETLRELLDDVLAQPIEIRVFDNLLAFRQRG